MDPRRRDPARPAAGRVRKPMSEWLHLQQDVYPAYISWEQYVINQERIQQNSLRFVENRQKAQGVVRNGPGLLQGMVLCGRCGHYLQVVYKHTPRYVCRGLVRTADVRSVCTSIRAPVLDQVVVEAFFEAIQPAQIDALEAILAAQRAEREQLERHWQERLKRAQYAAQLAQRQYDAVDPENRLVAAELERRWEAELRQLLQVEEEYQDFQQTPVPDAVPPQLRDLFRDVSTRLPELWPGLSNAQKKELLRSLISHVIVKRPVPDQIEARIVWISGHYSDYTAITPVHSEKDVTGYDEMVDRIQELCKQGHNDDQMAAQLTEEGFHSARSPHVTSDSVMKIRLARKWYLPRAQMRGVEEVDGFLTTRGLARQLGLNSSTICRYIYKGIIPPEDVTRDPASRVYLIRNDPWLVDQLHKRVVEQKKRNGMLKSTSP
jgi:hypothetical protein